MASLFFRGSGVHPPFSYPIQRERRWPSVPSLISGSQARDSSFEVSTLLLFASHFCTRPTLSTVYGAWPQAAKATIWQRTVALLVTTTPSRLRCYSELRICAADLHACHCIYGYGHYTRDVLHPFISTSFPLRSIPRKWVPLSSHNLAAAAYFCLSGPMSS
ncbi:hypothetical protein IF1G_05836 [Cordyceps javanica]|uniref:Uncharacterized protein n=1 Tax=Cordyceps javanica TaxID=43265 RepID=A0A545V2T0_9HYPO|nr:hypothetical protein IF1G_05836 [Cordyceps javanica]TQW06791.1 hypothetical protein IF2G_05175 [Cordyceps javanica]